MNGSYTGIITVVAVVNVKGEELDKFKSAVSDIMGPTRAEDGNFSYDFHQSIETPTEFVFLETWGSQGALDQHMVSPHMRSFFAKIGPLLMSPPAVKTYRRLYKGH